MNRLLLCEPLETPKGTFTSIEDAIEGMTFVGLSRALAEYGAPVSVRTLKHWAKPEEVRL